MFSVARIESPSVQHVHGPAEKKKRGEPHQKLSALKPTPLDRDLNYKFSMQTKHFSAFVSGSWGAEISCIDTRKLFHPYQSDMPRIALLSPRVHPACEHILSRYRCHRSQLIGQLAHAPCKSNTSGWHPKDLSDVLFPVEKIVAPNQNRLRLLNTWEHIGYLPCCTDYFSHCSILAFFHCSKLSFLAWLHPW